MYIRFVVKNDPRNYYYQINCDGFECSQMPGSSVSLEIPLAAYEFWYQVCQENQDDSRQWSAGLMTPGNVIWYLNSSTEFTVIYNNGNDSRLVLYCIMLMLLDFIDEALLISMLTTSSN